MHCNDYCTTMYLVLLSAQGTTRKSVCERSDDGEEANYRNEIHQMRLDVMCNCDGMSVHCAYNKVCVCKAPFSIHSLQMGANVCLVSDAVFIHILKHAILTVG